MPFIIEDSFGKVQKNSKVIELIGLNVEIRKLGKGRNAPSHGGTRVWGREYYIEGDRGEGMVKVMLKKEKDEDWKYTELSFYGPDFETYDLLTPVND